MVETRLKNIAAQPSLRTEMNRSSNSIGGFVRVREKPRQEKVCCTFVGYGDVEHGVRLSIVRLRLRCVVNFFVLSDQARQ